MSTAYDWTGPARKLTDRDLPRVGHFIGVGEDEIHAVIDVEAAGSGFDSKNRVKMLFEPHIFWRELGPGPKRDRAADLGLARPRWIRDYPRDSYPRLEQAMQIDLDAAMNSASWGMGQIMGFNHKLAGYPTAERMANAFRESEGVQLEAMIRFIQNTGLDAALRTHDWHAFARGYNGKGYRKNNYHTKLANAYARWSRIRDTPWSPDEPTPAPRPAVLEPEKAPREQDPTSADDTPGWISGLFAAIVGLFSKR